VTTGAETSGGPILLGPGVVVTAFAEPEIITDGAVAWAGDRIVAVATAAELRTRHPDAPWIDARGGMVLPGLVNLHHHFYSSLARGLDPGRRLKDFGEILDGLWWRLDRALDRDAVRLSAALAVADSIRWGVTTVFDHHASPSCLDGSLALIADEVEAAGLSAVLCYEVSDRNGHDEALRGLDENIAFASEHLDHGRVRGMLGLHASFTVSDATMRAAADRRVDGMGCHLHVAEDPLDLRVSKMVHGAGPVERLARHGLIDRRTLAVHGIHLSSADRRRLADADAVIVHNPESNANNGVGRLDLDAAAADGCRLGLGTDGMSSAMLPALRAAFLAARGGRRDPTAGFTVVPNLLATNVAVAAELLDEPMLGRLAPGAPADLCVLGAAPPTPVTADNLFAHLVYGAAAQPVRHTVARGRVLMNDYRLATIDPQALAGDAREVGPRLWRRFHELDPSLPDWLPSGG
jgi:putative selenium metabolism protein SsnA